ncbi:unnamed protein product [Chilo suppressalis]|uniref:FP protein C-terminal domain-containing protein n=1 Tax=Chilo suppressalis TaxID=168631 RepID=A0ABN8AQ14_CHISP|nr:unnamed protein product [Chilo suppressalis]
MSNPNSTFNQLETELAMSVGEVTDILYHESPPNFVTQRNKIDSELRNDFKCFKETILTTLESWFAKQDVKHDRLLKEFEEIGRSLSFMCEKYEDLKKSTEDMSKRLEVLEKNSAKDSQSQRITELELKMDIMDQQARQCNVEISNLPEKRGEDLSALMQEIGVLVKQPITQQDIISVHRVPHVNTVSKQPKNIIMKLASRVLRDKLLASVRLAKGVTTGQLNMPGTSQNVYVNEHLTLKTKKLFRETRIAAKDCEFKFTWIKNGNILVRRNKTSPIFSVRCPEDLQKIKKL